MTDKSMYVSKEMLIDIAFMLEHVDAYDRLPSYGKGRQYEALARQVRAIIKEQDNDLQASGETTSDRCM